jgi:hypothetical protein
MSKLKGKWLNFDSNLLTTSGDDLTVNLDNDTLSADLGGGGIFIKTVSGATIVAGTVADDAFTSVLVKADGTMSDGSTVMTGNLDFGGTNTISGLVTPTADDHAATKIYVDSLAAGLDPKASVRVATVGTDLGATYVSGGGTGGTGQFTGAPSTLDGITLADGDRVLVKDQTDAKENGIYAVTSTTTTWERASDHDGSPAAEVSVGNYTFVEAGTLNSDNGYVLQKDGATDGVLALNVNDINWTQFSGAGQITAGAGLDKSGNTLSAVVDGLTIVISGNAITVNDAGITNTKLVNDSVTVTAGNGLTTGGTVALGGSVTLDANPADFLSGGNAQLQGDELFVEYNPGSGYSSPADNNVSGHFDAIATALATAGTGDGNVSAGANFTDNVLIKGIGGTTHVEETTITVDDSNNLTVAADTLVSGNIVGAGQAYTIEHDIGTTSGATAIDWDNGNVQHVTLDGDISFTESNAKAGSTYILIVEQDATGGHDITAYPTAWEFPGGVDPTLTTAANGVNIFAAVYSGVDSKLYVDVRNDEAINAEDIEDGGLLALGVTFDSIVPTTAASGGQINPATDTDDVAAALIGADNAITALSASIASNANKVVDKIDYSGAQVTNKVVGPLTSTPLVLGAAVEVTPVGAIDQEHSVDYTVGQLTAAGTTGLALGYYILIATDSISGNDGTWTGSPPSTGIDGTLSSGDDVKISYAG